MPPRTSPRNPSNQFSHSMLIVSMPKTTLTYLISPDLLYCLSMQHFDLDFDEDNEEFNNNSALASQRLETANQNKYNPSALTQGLFRGEEEEDYEQETKPDPASQAKSPNSKKEEEGGRKRRRKVPTKLTPLKQQDKVQVFENCIQPGHQEDELEQISLDTSKQVNHQLKVEETEKVQKIQTNTTNAFVFDDPEVMHPRASRQPRFVEEREETVEEREEAVVAGTGSRNVLGQFEEESDDQNEVDAAPVVAIVGSQYFDYSTSESLKKQLLAEVRQSNLIRTELIRDKSGFNTFWPEFHMYFCQNNHYLMSAKKTSSKPMSTFIMSSSKDSFEESSSSYLGKMKSNVIGDMLNIYGPGLNPSNAKEKKEVPRQLLATIVYSSNLFQMGKPRQFSVYIKNPEVKYYSAFPQVKMYEDEINLSQLFEYPENKDKIATFGNRKPQWVEHLGGYMLNFKGRVEAASIKNFILEKEGHPLEAMVFGKVSDSKFNLDMLHPISPLIAFGVALSSFDSRIMCE